MSIFDEPKIDCHNHVFDPARFEFSPRAHYLPVGAELGTRAQLTAVFETYGVQRALVIQPSSSSDWPFLRAAERIDYGPLLKLIEHLVPAPTDRSKLLWHTPNRLFGFADPPPRTDQSTHG